MNLFAMMDSSGGAMQAERMRAEVVAANMANAETTRTASGPATALADVGTRGVDSRDSDAGAGDSGDSTVGAKIPGCPSRAGARAPAPWAGDSTAPPPLTASSGVVSGSLPDRPPTRAAD